MGRHPIGDRAMTGAERQRRRRQIRAARIAELSRLAEQAKLAPANDLVLRVDHVRRFPGRTAEWLARRIGPEAATTFRDALGRAIEAAGETA
jgi:hypothetical protein